MDDHNQPQLDISKYPETKHRKEPSLPVAVIYHDSASAAEAKLTIMNSHWPEITGINHR